jgi:hypothetical protein
MLRGAHDGNFLNQLGTLLSHYLYPSVKKSSIVAA